MMTQEEFVDVKEMRDAGMTLSEIAEKTGYHRTTIAKWIADGGPPVRRAPAADRVVLTDRWQTRIAELLEQRPALLSTSLHDLLTAEGFDQLRESIFATVRLRQRITKWPGCRDAGVAMAYKLLDAAQARWRRINGPELVALVRAGATFVDGHLQERNDTDAHAA